MHRTRCNPYPPHAAFPAWDVVTIADTIVIMLTPKRCKELDPSLKAISDERIQALLNALYLYAEFFWDQYRKTGKGVPGISREALEAELRSRVR